MRMDTTNPFSAYEVVNTYPEKDLVRILYLYGEEKDAKGIARNIVRARQGAPIETTGQLVDLIKAAKSPKELAKKGHPAKQTFQALRIEVKHDPVSCRTPECIPLFPGVPRTNTERPYQTKTTGCSPISVTAARFT
ncbi:MAG: 16S rRNA (cytosine(1402)-N(4))-methyltransferase, partial [Oscillospiraceae bacterium]|nr:16S rRNA (cytosine(1402)-N(4))-methyltransferase [Oscillospiraceae bacterium]